MNKKVLLIIASRDFQPKEYLLPKEVLEQGGVKVITASDKGGTAVADSYGGANATVDLLVGDAKVENFDGAFIVGGQGAKTLLETEDVYNLMRAFHKAGKFYGAICYSPRILAHAGVLQGKNATGWNGDDELPGILQSVGAKYSAEPVVVDGKLITAVDPTAAKQWGEEILKNLKI